MNHCQLYQKRNHITSTQIYRKLTINDAENINSVFYLKEADIDTLEVTGKIKDFVTIVRDKYHEIASEFP